MGRERVPARREHRGQPVVADVPAGRSDLRGRIRKYRAPRMADCGNGGRLGAAPVGLHHDAQPRRAGGPALSGHTAQQSAAFLAEEPVHCLFPPGFSGLGDRSARSRGCQRSGITRATRLDRRRSVGGGSHLRSRRRLAAGALPPGKRIGGRGAGHRPLALHPAPELLWRGAVVVGYLPPGRGRRRVVDRVRAPADDLPASARVGRGPARKGHQRSAARLPPVHRAHQRLHSVAAAILDGGPRGESAA